MAGKRWDHAIAVEEKKWDHEFTNEEKKLQWEADKKEKDRQFEINKLERQGIQENKAKKYEVLAKFVESGKSLEDIERLAKLFE